MRRANMVCGTAVCRSLFIRTPEEAKGAKYCLLADDNSDRNRMYADRISRRLKEEGGGRFFIGCLDDEFAAEDEGDL